MSRIKLVKGAIVFYKNKEYKLVKPIDFTKVIIQDVVDKNILLEVEICNLSSQKKENQKEIYLDNHTNEEWEIAQNRFKIIKELVFRKRTKQEVIDIAKANKVATTTIYRWIKFYEETESVSSLVPNVKNRGPRGSQLDIQVEIIITEVLEDLYLNKQRYKFNVIYRKIKKGCLDKGVDCPHENTIRNRIDAIDPELSTKRRYSRKTAKEHYSNYDGEFPDGKYPLDTLQIDHTPIDIILVDEKFRKPIGRPHLTLAIDVYSRMVAGFYISLQSPGYFNVGQCLYRAFLPKEDFLKKQGVNGKWSIYGIPRVIHVDNGSDLVSEDMKRVCSELNVELKKRPVGGPQFGPHIERYFGTLKDEVHNLSGTTFSSIAEKAEYDSIKNAVFTLSEFTKWITHYIVDIYHKKYHSGIENTPEKKYEVGIFGDEHTLGTGQLPSIIENKEAIKIALLPTFFRTIQKDGITLDGISYYGDVLRHWINRRDNKKQKIKFKVKRDPLNIKKIYFYDHELKEYFEIYYRKIEAPEMTLWDMLAAKRYLKEKFIKDYNENDIFEAYETLERIEQESKDKTKKVKLRKSKSIKMREIKEKKELEVESNTDEEFDNDLFINVETFDIYKK